MCRVAVDDEFVSLMKLIEADMKRMSGLLATYEDKKADLKPEEKQERLRVIKLLKESLRIVKVDFEMQTKQFEMGNYLGDPYLMEKPSQRGAGLYDDNTATIVTDTSQVGFSLNNDRRLPNDNIMLNNKRIDSPDQSKSAPSTPLSGVGSDGNLKENSFVTICNEAQKMLEALEKKHLIVEGELDEAV